MSRRLVLFSVMTALALPGVARAQEPPAPATTHEPSAGDLATARNALKEGLSLREKGDLPAALGRFQTAFDLVQTPVTAFELGKTHLLMGHVMHAREMFERIGRMPLTLEESDRSATARAEAEHLGADLEPRVPTLRIRVKIPEGATATVRIDEDPITLTGALTSRAVDPGKHLVIGRAGDGPEEKVTIEIGESETKDVDLAPQWVPPKEPAGAAGQVVYLRQTSPWVFVGFTIASVALTVTGVSAVFAVNAANRAHDECGNDYCPQYVRDTDISVMRRWLVATVASGIVTAGATVLGVVYINRPTTERVVSSLKPYVGFGTAGVMGSF